MSNDLNHHWESSSDLGGNDHDYDMHHHEDDDDEHSESNWIHEQDHDIDNSSDLEHNHEDDHDSDEFDGIIERDDDDEGEEHEYFGPGMSSRDFMNTLRQHMRDNQHREDGHEVQDENGRMNLSEVLPELLSMMGSAGGSGLRNRSDASSRHSRIAKLVENVENAEVDPYFAMESIIELSENLLMVNQIIIERIFPMDKLLTALINILDSNKLKDEMELQLQCCRCVYNIFEVHPESISHAVDRDIIMCLQGKLMEINYIDLAEQVLETLELLSRICGRDILQNGNLAAYIQYFDFFTIHAQRKSIAIVANACAHVHKSDFETIESLFVALKPIFLNCTDQTINDRILSILYGTCGGLKDKTMLESIFTFDITQHLIELISSTDTASDGRLKCLDILAFIVGASSEISSTIIQSSDLASMLKQCLYQYSKNSNASIHETIMFVPKNLLNSISRFIALLFPAEDEQILTISKDDTESVSEEILNILKNDEKVSDLLTKLIPLLSEIFVNTVDFNTRRNVLIGLTRICNRMNNTVATNSATYLVKLLGSSLAQCKSALERESNNPFQLGVLLIGLLQLVKVLEKKFAPVFASPFQREGIYETMKFINQDVLRLQEKGQSKTHQEPVFDVDDEDIEDIREDADKDADDDSDDDMDNEYLDDMDIPKEVPPKKLKFRFLNQLESDTMLDSIVESTELILSLVDSTGDVNNGDLATLKAKVEKIRSMPVGPDSEGGMDRCIMAIKECVLGEGTPLSAFEVISSGLPEVLAEKFGNLDKESSIELYGAARSAFCSIELATEFVSILQSAVTRSESFAIVDSGIQGENSGMESLGKQIKLHLQYDGDDKLFTPLSTVVVSIHCIASFKVLETFIKDRAAKAKLFSWMLPSSDNEAPEDSKKNSAKDAKLIANSVLKFSYEGESIDAKDTIFGAIFKILKDKGGKEVKDMWDDVQTIYFSMIDVSSDNTDGNEVHEDAEEDKDYDMEAEDSDLSLDNIYPVDRLTVEEPNGPCENILKFMKAFKEAYPIGDNYVNSKLSAKLTRQLDEPLVVAGGVLPEWTQRLTRDYPFLFPFDTRIFFLRCTSFGYGRFIQLWKERMSVDKQLSSDDPLLQLGRVSRSKILIGRNDILLAALRILDDYSKSATILEFQYVDEEGTGLGPTLEFYSLVSKEFAQKKLNMWRTPEYYEETDYVTGSLFPKPICSIDGDKTKVLELFDRLGIFLARSLLDNRLVDFRFNTAFFQLAHQLVQGKPLTFNSIYEPCTLIGTIDKQLAQSLRYVFVSRREQDKLEEMCLTFVLPGTNIELIDNGARISVDESNVEDYIQLVISHIIGQGITEQIQSFITGFSKVFPYSNLLIFTPSELVDMFGRVEEDWSTETLYSCIDANHGYSMDSVTVHNLISIMTEFSSEERHSFLQFISGSPKLPLGGFKALKPRLTVVLKHAEAGSTPDEYLPSVMTCANYLKLPKYSSKEVMRQRIVQAMNEGAGAFLLS